MKLHVDGKWIRDEDGQIVILQGVNKAEYGWSPTGDWQKPGESDPIWGDQHYDVTVMQSHLQTMKSWNINVIRAFTNFYLWKNPDVYWWSLHLDYEQILRDFIEAAASEGIYIILVSGCHRYQDCSPPPGGLPYPPYTSTEQSTVITSKQDFIDTSFDIISEFASYDNVLFSPWNEPKIEARRTEWFSTMQDIADLARAADIQNILVAEWLGYVGDYEDYDFSFFRTNQLTGGNIIYDIHMYRSGFADHPYTYAALKRRLVNDQIDAAEGPVLVGEVGADLWGGERSLEEQYFANLLQILNGWRIGHLAWSWWPELESGPWYAKTFSLFQNESSWVIPNSAGQILIDSNVRPPRSSGFRIGH